MPAYSSKFASSLLIVIILFISSVQIQSKSEHRHATLSRLLSGIDNHDENVQIVHIRRVRSNGEFLHDVSLKNHNRRKRSVSEDLSASPLDDDHEVYLHMDNALGMQEAKLYLKRNYKLISKNFVIEERGRGGKIVNRKNMVDDCHYHGKVRNHNGYSKIALSLCEGVQGYISVDSSEYIIEPLWNHTSPSQDSSEAHPHVIYKRSIFKHLQERKDDKNDLGHCGYSDKDKAAGGTPWWKVDPRDSTRDRGTEEEEDDTEVADEEEDEFDIQVEQSEEKEVAPTKNKKRRGHKNRGGKRRNNKKRRGHKKSHKNHRTSAGRSDVSDIEENEPKSRSRRSISEERNVETLVVADKMLVGYHGRQEVEKYILTIMNIASSLYHDATIGNAINIIVTRIVLLTENQPNLEINHHADKSLDSFCKWQAKINVNETSSIPESGIAHHDNAVLITGFDICTYSNKPCGTLGLAPVAGMCQPTRSCNINEDIGLSSAFTIAHEIGHNFGMQHDGTQNDCGLQENEPDQIMAGQMTKNTRPFTWSRCSRKYITDFLDSSSGKCLSNTPPRRDFDFPTELPGQQHDADEQCRFSYGPQSRQCKYGDVCRDLWCLNKKGVCVTNSIPAAEGTDCHGLRIGKGWCYRGECVPFGHRPNAVDGSWGEWSLWSDCSRTCGGGARSSYRHCDSPAPEHGGKYCIGQRKRYESCNTEKCNATDKTFREEQCAQFDSEPFRGKYYNWKPFVGGYNVNPCSLNCLAESYNFYTERAPAVVDGTRCFPDSLDMCISGECHHVGCDHVLNSDAVEDKCRICGGDGSTCQTVKAIFNSPVAHGQYREIVRIPKGSVHIRIEEMEISTDNYLALKNTDGQNFINGGWTIDWPRKFEIAGTTFSYKRPFDEPETLVALGPTTEDLVVMILVQDNNKGVKYEYNVPVEHIMGSGDGDVNFEWDFGSWTECSQTCAGGSQRRPVICKRSDDDTEVQPAYCDQKTKPSQETRPCNLEPCESKWAIADWQPCTHTCGGGERTRSVTCMRKISAAEDEIVSDHFCTEAKPISEETCNVERCPPQWVAAEWSACSPSCGSGWKNREVTCQSSEGGEIESSECDQTNKPPTRTRCSNQACPPPKWRVGRWGTCSAKCGRGRQSRPVKCLDHNRKPSNRCPRHRKPSNYKSCQATCKPTKSHEIPTSSHPLAPAAEQCRDETNVSYCPLVQKFNFCGRAFFRKTCCATCAKLQSG